MVTKKSRSGNSAANRSITAAFAKIEQKSKDNNSQLGLETSQTTNTNSNSNPSPPPQKQSTLGMGQFSNNELNNLKCENAPSPSPSLLQQHMDDVAADDDDLLSEELDDYDPHELDEEEYISIEQYEQQIQQRQQQRQQHLQQQQLMDGDGGGIGQFDLGKEQQQMQTYQIVEQEIPLY